jgi:hypothetical protein
MIEKEISGKVRGFKCGTYTFTIIRELTGVDTVQEVFRRLFPIPGAETSIENLDFINKFYFACAKHYCKSKKIEVDFEEVDVQDWIEELGADESLDVMSNLLKTYSEKNLKAPETTPGPEQQ